MKEDEKEKKCRKWKKGVKNTDEWKGYIMKDKNKREKMRKRNEENGGG